MHFANTLSNSFELWNAKQFITDVGQQYICDKHQYSFVIHQFLCIEFLLVIPYFIFKLLKWLIIRNGVESDLKVTNYMI